jgi:hypothetical protein
MAALTKTRLIILHSVDPTLILINPPLYECAFTLKVDMPLPKSKVFISSPITTLVSAEHFVAWSIR